MNKYELQNAEQITEVCYRIEDLLLKHDLDIPSAITACIGVFNKMVLNAGITKEAMLRIASDSFDATSKTKGNM